MMQPDAVQMWAGLAERGLKKTLRLAEDPPYPEGVCFYAQQAVEKAPKACCCALGAERVPRTHDLVELAELMAELGGEAPESDPLELLSRYAVSARYEVPIPAPEDAQEALQMVEDLCTELLNSVSVEKTDEDEDELEEADSAEK
jgi:HEPN domain-containing protein